MRRRLSLLVSLLRWPLAVLTQDGTRLDPWDIRPLQAALVWSGGDARLTDGEWLSGSLQFGHSGGPLLGSHGIVVSRLAAAVLIAPHRLRTIPNP